MLDIVPVPPRAFLPIATFPVPPPVVRFNAWKPIAVLSPPDVADPAICPTNVEYEAPPLPAVEPIATSPVGEDTP